MDVEAILGGLQMENEIRPLHTDGHKNANAAQIRRMLMMLGGIALAAIILIVLSFIWRDATHMNNPNERNSQFLTIGITAVFGSLVLFLWSMKLSPRLAYRKHLAEAYRGLSRVVEGEVKGVDGDLSFREGLYFYGCVVSVGSLDDPEDDRLLYWDAQLGSPPFAVGEAVRIRAHGNDIIGIAALT